MTQPLSPLPKSGRRQRGRAAAVHIQDTAALYQHLQDQAEI